MTWLPGVGWEGNPQENLYNIKFFLSKYQTFPKTFESIFIFDVMIYVNLVIPLFAKTKIIKSGFVAHSVYVTLILQKLDTVLYNLKHNFKLSCTHPIPQWNLYCYCIVNLG